MYKGIDIEGLFSLIQTYQSHIDTQRRIIRHIQHELKLCLADIDKEDIQQILKEIIVWIDKLEEEESK